jgi:hypothetical protein
MKLGDSKSKNWQILKMEMYRCSFRLVAEGKLREPPFAELREYNMGFESQAENRL